MGYINLSTFSVNCTFWSSFWKVFSFYSYLMRFFEKQQQQKKHCFYLVTFGYTSNGATCILLCYASVHIPLRGRWSAPPRPAGTQLWILPQPGLLMTPMRAAGVWLSNRTIHSWINSAQHSGLQMYDVSRRSEKPLLTESCESVCCCNTFIITHL